MPNESTPTLELSKSSLTQLSFFPLITKGDTSGDASVLRSLPPRPNILLIVSDDQRFDTMEYMPLTKARIFDQGISFKNGYITTSSCCPSRASIFTGMYAHNHGVLLNEDPLKKDTFVKALYDVGYNTALVGKYLNSWDGEPRSEFDYWVSFDGGGSPYYDPELNVQGEWSIYPGYITHILSDFALDFLQSASQQSAPFLLIFAPTAPHEPAEPAPGDEALYSTLALHRPPNFNEQDVSDKPGWMQERHLLREDEIETIYKLRQKQLQTLHSLDVEVSEIFDFLASENQLDNTFVVYLSDNGYFWGEHRLARGKGYAYEESIHVPFAIRYPPLIPSPRQETHIVANIDLAPTIYQLAGLPIPSNTDGFSLLSLMQGDSDWRDKLVVENWIRYGPYIGVRSERYLYVEWENNTLELYDLGIDAYQLQNLANLPEYAQLIADFHGYLQAIKPVQR